jgi:hypothetical protein
MSSPDRPAIQPQNHEPLFPKGETEAFPGNWVNFYGDYCTHGVWSAGGLCCAADDLPIREEFREKIRARGFNYYGKTLAQSRGEVIDDTFGHCFDHEGIDLARQIKAYLPHWIVDFSSEFRAYRTPAGKHFGLIRSDGSFDDLSPEELQLREAIREYEW